MALLRGGRGVKAPWESTHLRVPDPIKAEIQARIDNWKAEQLGASSNPAEKTLTGKEVEAIAREVLKQKKSARVSIQKLLVELGYQVEL